MNITFSSLSEWLAWLERERPIDTIHLGLENLTPIAQKLQIDKFSPKVVTVAGTNGKGTCVATLEAIAVQAGLKVATYTSPHLIKFTERIRVQGQPVREEVCSDLFQNFANQLSEAQARSLTYFEWVTLAALYYFKNLNLDLIILEVGLGGRLDAVNVVENDISVITNIAFDHQDFLGNTLGEIATEKAGIIKRDSIVVGASSHLPQEIYDKVDAEQAQFYLLGRDFALVPEEFADVFPPLPQPSVSAAIQCGRLLASAFGLKIEDSDIARGLSSVKLPGRFSQLEHQGRWVLDVGHNMAAVNWLVDELRKNKFNQQRIHIIFGVCKDKSWQEMLDYFCDLNDFEFSWYTTNIPAQRGLPFSESSTYLTQRGKQVQGCQSVIQACEQASSHRDKDETILIVGSFFTVAEAYQYLSHQQQTSKLAAETSAWN